MTISFKSFPANTIRIPGVFLEIDASRANTGLPAQREALKGKRATVPCPHCGEHTGARDKNGGQNMTIDEAVKQVAWWREKVFRIEQ